MQRSGSTSYRYWFLALACLTALLAALAGFFRGHESPPLHRPPDDRATPTTRTSKPSESVGADRAAADPEPTSAPRTAARQAASASPDAEPESGGAETQTPPSGAPPWWIEERTRAPGTARVLLARRPRSLPNGEAATPAPVVLRGHRGEAPEAATGGDGRGSPERSPKDADDPLVGGRAPSQTDAKPDETAEERR